MKEKIAIPLKGVPSVVLLDNGDRMTREKAERVGYRIIDEGAVKFVDAVNTASDTLTSWRLAIECLPEARERAAATAELIESRNPETLTLEQARSFLRGLPTEQLDTTEETMTTNNDPRAARLAEISYSMSGYNTGMAYSAKPKAAPHAAAPSNAEPLKLKRLTEIRLNALHMNGHGRTQEAKTLKLALDTHNSVGTPLAQALAQLGIDAAKLAS